MGRSDASLTAPPTSGPTMKPREPAALKAPMDVVRIASGVASVVISRLGTNITAETTPSPSISAGSREAGLKPTAIVARP